MLQYNYNWGDENIHSSSIEVIRNGDEKYTTIFIQQGDDPGYFLDLEPKYGKLISKNVEDEDGDFDYMSRRIITMITKECCNPRPEKIFRIVYNKNNQEETMINKPIILN